MYFKSCKLIYIIAQHNQEPFINCVASEAYTPVFPEAPWTEARLSSFSCWESTLNVTSTYD